jgi:hypothetical protein
VQDQPLRLRRPAIDLVQQGGEVGGDHVDHVLGERLAGVEIRRTPDRSIRPLDVAAVLPGKRAKGCGRVVDDLPAQVLLDVLAPDADRRRRADVRLRCHREDVAGLADPDTGRGGPRPVGIDVDDHRDLRRQLRFVDVLHRVGQAAGRIEKDDDRVVALLVRALDLADGVVGRDRVDVVVELDREDPRRRGGVGGRNDRGYRERGQNSPQSAAFHGVRIVSRALRAEIPAANLGWRL